MEAIAELRVLLESGQSLITVTTTEEFRVLATLRAVGGSTPLWTWSSASGLCRDGAAPVYGSADPDKVLDDLVMLTAPWTVVLCDPGVLLADATAVRQLKEIAQRANPGQTVVLVGAQLTIPPELVGLARAWTLPAPTTSDLTATIERVEVRVQQRGLRSELSDADRLRLARALTGLTITEAERELMALAVADSRLSPDDIATALADKAALLNTDGVLEVVTDGPITLGDLGGLHALKEWLGRRRLDDGRGADAPRGVLLAGVPGCGKSAVARAIAAEWSVPLVLLDPGRVYRKFVGESEQRFDAALATTAAMAPVVLWIDEIEKAFAIGDVDGGVSGRILATFLRWLQDRPAGVFVVATANDVTRLPPELTRKGRFDELFFVDLPSIGDRTEILEIALRHREVAPTPAELSALATASAGFSGAELDAAITAASYRGPVTVGSVAAELAATVPLAHARAQEIAALRSWATDHARAA
jgi:predicted ATPase